MQSREKKGLSGFKYAQEGILHCFRTQPHMRYHFYTLVAVLLSGLLLRLDTRDMLVLVFAITLVIVTELVNTSIEAVVDMVTENYSPIAKVAKDVAAGAVLIAAMNAIIAGVLIFFAHSNLKVVQDQMTKDLPSDVMKVLVVCIVLLTLVVIISKLLSNTGTPWHGGIVSGHSAIGFLLAMTIFFTTKNTVVAIMAILLAILVAQSRVEAGVHTIREVILGAVLAILLTSLVYRVMPAVHELLDKRSAKPASLPESGHESQRTGRSERRRFEGVVFLANASSG